MAGGWLTVMTPPCRRRVLSLVQTTTPSCQRRIDGVTVVRASSSSIPTTISGSSTITATTTRSSSSSSSNRTPTVGSSLPLFVQRRTSQPTRQQPQQQRMMVVVTQTKPSNWTTPHQETDDSTTPTSTNTSNTAGTLTVTDRCLERIQELIQQKQHSKQDDPMTIPLLESYYLRVYVDAGGCSGFTYKFELDTMDHFDPDDDLVVVYDETDTTKKIPRVVVDQSTLNLIHGSTLDYVEEMIKSAFVVKDNPQSESACGCGSSFAVKNFTANPALD